MTIERPAAELTEKKVSLSDAQVAERVAICRRAGEFEPQLRKVWQHLGEDLKKITREFWHEQLVNTGKMRETEIGSHIQRGLELIEFQYTQPIDSMWVRRMAERGDQVQNAGVSTAVLVEGITRCTEIIYKRLAEVFADQPEFASQAAITIHRLNCIEIELLLTHLTAIEGNQAARVRQSGSEEFRGAVTDILSSALRDSTELRHQTVATSNSARGMLGKTSEVAAAAEQSAVAMREAAQTAAGLIRAIEQARGEVEVAAQVATRAAQRSAQAVTVSDSLSDHAQAIESILGLIRDIAGQTNLLALNATIEAARAGEAGRGFAVVAQEVKSLANQTARATDDIAAKIAAIQAATRQTVDANGSIRDIVGEVQTSAQRIREAMETQAQTVTMITAAVDETALAADSMSSTIAAIRMDTENVAGEIDQLQSGFESVDMQLSRLETTTGDFVNRMVA